MDNKICGGLPLKISFTCVSGLCSPWEKIRFKQYFDIITKAWCRPQLQSFYHNLPLGSIFAGFISVFFQHLSPYYSMCKFDRTVLLYSLAKALMASGDCKLAILISHFLAFSSYFSRVTDLTMSRYMLKRVG